MKYYIDFDNTLFNTKLFFNDLMEIFKNNHVDTDIINYHDKDLLGRIFQKEIDVSCISSEKTNIDNLLKDLDNLTNNLPSYLFDDTIYFLDFMKENNYYLILLTYGNKDYQSYKINNANIKDYFKEIIITDKIKYNLDIDYTKGIFIDDRLDNILGFKNKKGKVIYINRNKDLLGKRDIIEYNSLKELIDRKIV